MSDPINKAEPLAATWGQAEKTWKALSGGMQGHAQILGRPVEVCVVHSLLSTIKRREAEIVRLRALKDGV